MGLKNNGFLETPPMAGSSTSLSSKDVASAISLYEPSSNQDNLDNLSMKAVYEMDSEDSISRPLSRGSVTSGVSMMATKDGVEGEKVKRLGIPQYSLNLLNTMAHSQHKKMHGNSQAKNAKYLSQADSPSSPPMTLRDKMRLLGNEKQIPLVSNSSEGFDETLMHDSAQEKYNNSTSNYSLHVPETGTGAHAMSEIDSNSSTVGDDSSFQNLRNLSPALGSVYNDRD
ncbi:uncharacterized protein ZBIST_2448 [Zygosaccharomyces bailii]|uniref:ZYBA0S04-02608g1_1 n=1 Tax=Zygosaccharomyces bailii (strain CLIB 213 / ATCC 58445 / CBS 680 / BCRC 21525 / NBRC 1098 / NCYC 1416 / NRRL Y-2227) TaxID=1333698 RepID=A0A8J2X8C0_ZYGB2|nr:ZYBA0S04-02608g1_1 [Zygosaccharomyces bailii CLIB 213]CDH08329.1 uncharacterized protein ZBAI_00111 [Zygosaccharomyces bailii ISA1307]SJM85755.1 uncharacterized protein ZBIST_2448 [Zygosaccharomyces bailii]